ncbi:MAG TPA: helix-turn-helix domain-containing protein [Ferrovibrio sp.]|uniref:helix-turn-helix domain-containing protein n=1 Tax=Ferrovibrio sp. TaxID=1917215 RepID=UPI002ED6BE38
MTPLKRANPAPLAGDNRADDSSKLDNQEHTSTESPEQPDRQIFARLPQAAIFDPNLPASALRVLAALCAYIDQEGKCWPSIGTLAERLGDGYSPRMVQRHLRALEAAGHISIELQPNGVGKSSNLYRVRFETRPAAEGRVTQCDTPTPDTVCHPGVTQDDTRGCHRMSP